MNLAWTMVEQFFTGVALLWIGLCVLFVTFMTGYWLVDSFGPPAWKRRRQFHVDRARAMAAARARYERRIQREQEACHE